MVKRDKLLIEWANAVKERDMECQICGKKPPYRLNAHHLIPKNFPKYKYDIDNGILLCVHHHGLGKWSAHKNPIWFSRWLCKNRFQQYREILERLHNLEEQNGA